MRFSNIAIIAISALSFTALAGSKVDEPKVKSDDSRTESTKHNTKLAALTPAGTQSSSMSHGKTAKPGAEPVQGDNVQGLATSDRRYRYHD